MRRGVRIANGLLVAIAAAGLLWVTYWSTQWVWPGPPRPATRRSSIPTVPRDEWLYLGVGNFDELLAFDRQGTAYAARLNEADRLYPPRPSGFPLTAAEPAGGHPVKAIPSTIYLEDGVALPHRSGSVSAGPDQRAQREAETERKMALLQSVLDEHPGPPWGDAAAMLLAYTLVHLEKHEAAIPLLERAMDALAEPYAQLHVPLQLVAAYEQMGRPDDALRTLRRALTVSDSVVLWQRLAALLEHQGDLFEAARLYGDLAAAPRHGAAEPWRSQFAAKADELQVQADQRLDVTHGAVTGTVRMNGQTLAGVDVYVVHDLDRRIWQAASVSAVKTRTNDRGEYVAYGVPAGRYRIGVRLPQHVAGGALVRFDPVVVHVQGNDFTTAHVVLEKTPRLLQVEFLDAVPHPLLHVAWEPDPRAAAYTLAMDIVSPESEEVQPLDGHSLLPTTDTTVRLPWDGPFVAMLAESSTQSSPDAVPGLPASRSQLRIQVIPLDESGTPFIGSPTAARIPGAEPDSYVVQVAIPH